MALLTKEQVSGYARLETMKLINSQVRPDDTGLLDGAFICNDYYITVDGIPSGSSWLASRCLASLAGILYTDGALAGAYSDDRYVSLVRALPKSDLLKSGSCEARPHEKESNLTILTDYSRAKFTRILPESEQAAALAAINSGHLREVMPFTHSMDDKGRPTKTQVYEYNGMLVRKVKANLYDNSRNGSLDGTRIKDGQEYVQFAEPGEFLTTDKDDVAIDRYGISCVPFDMNKKVDISQNPHIADWEQEYERDSLMLGTELQILKGIMQESKPNPKKTTMIESAQEGLKAEKDQPTVNTDGLFDHLLSL